MLRKLIQSRKPALAATTLSVSCAIAVSASMLTEESQRALFFVAMSAPIGAIALVLALAVIIKGFAIGVGSKTGCSDVMIGTGCVAVMGLPYLVNSLVVFAPGTLREFGRLF